MWNCISPLMCPFPNTHTSLQTVFILLPNLLILAYVLTILNPSHCFDNNIFNNTKQVFILLALVNNCPLLHFRWSRPCSEVYCCWLLCKCSQISLYWNVQVSERLGIANLPKWMEMDARWGATYSYESCHHYHLLVHPNSVILQETITTAQTWK